MKKVSFVLALLCVLCLCPVITASATEQSSPDTDGAAVCRFDLANYCSATLAIVDGIAYIDVELIGTADVESITAFVYLTRDEGNENWRTIMSWSPSTESRDLSFDTDLALSDEGTYCVEVSAYFESSTQTEHVSFEGNTDVY